MTAEKDGRHVNAIYRTEHNTWCLLQYSSDNLFRGLAGDRSSIAIHQHHIGQCWRFSTAATANVAAMRAAEILNRLRQKVVIAEPMEVGPPEGPGIAEDGPPWFVPRLVFAVEKSTVVGWLLLNHADEPIGIVMDDGKGSVIIV